MAYKLGATSLSRLLTCHPVLQKLVHLAIAEAPEGLDFFVACGIRFKEEQELAVAEGNSELHWPDSFHNVDPRNPRNINYPYLAHAVDLVPWPSKWDNTGKFKQLIVHVKAIAVREGIDVYNGHDLWGWDAPHWQLGKAYER